MLESEAGTEILMRSRMKLVSPQSAEVARCMAEL